MPDRFSGLQRTWEKSRCVPARASPVIQQEGEASLPATLDRFKTDGVWYLEKTCAKKSGFAIPIIAAEKTVDAPAIPYWRRLRFKTS